MKTIDLVVVAQQVGELFDLAANEEIFIRLPNGKVFLLISVTDEARMEEDFADEIARTRQNEALMKLLHERSKEKKRVTSQEARRRLGLD